MLFSSPDYPLFLIAVFVLYALARGTDGVGAWARAGLMLLLGDLVFLLVAKDVGALWDPLGGLFYRVAARDPGAIADALRHALLVKVAPSVAWPLGRLVVRVLAGGGHGVLAVRWLIGSGVLAGAVSLGRRRAAWIASDLGQRRIAIGFVAGIAAIGATVLAAWQADALDAVTARLASGGHLAILFALGIAIGAAQQQAVKVLARVVVLFVASCLFYHAWAAAMPGVYRYLLALLLGTITLDYYLGIWIEDARTKAAGQALVAVSLLSNLGILFFFKYADFFTQDVAHLPVGRLHLLLPAGISFHTFQSLSYTIDVYRKELRATRSVVQFATFVLFFPQLVAGPIVRAQDLLPQLAAPPPLALETATRGLFRIACGLFKKIALADTLAIGIVERVFDNPERFSSLEVLAGVYAYALQIYLDFSAYSDIAIGSAQVLGFTLPENFLTPYRSANLQEFWRRWHISLSTWLRDYLYITLGGSRGAPWRTYANLIATMVLGGLWHGASWAFIVWGALHGLGLAVTRFFQRALDHARTPGAPLRLFAICAAIAVGGGAVHLIALADAGTWTQLVAGWLYLTPLWAFTTALFSVALPAPPVPPGTSRALLPELLRIGACVVGLGFLGALAEWPSWTWIPLAALAWATAIAADLVERGPDATSALLVALGSRVVAVVLVFHYVCFAWIFFRASSFDQALLVLRRLAALEFDHANLVPLVTTALAVGALCHFWADGSLRWMRDRFVEAPAWAQGLALAGAALVLRELGQTKIVPFIYFQF